MSSQIVCPACGLLMSAVPPGTITDCSHCGSVYRLDDLQELSQLEFPKQDPHGLRPSSQEA